MNYLRKVLARLKKADQTFRLIEAGDRLAIGLSGGKDSSLLLHCLHLYQKFANVPFEIVPIMLDLGFDNFNPQPLIDYFQQIGITINIVDAKTIYPILQANQGKHRHLPCSICSRMKKAAINKAAHTFNCNKVAFGHHYDDAIETLFLNILYGGKLATFSPKMFLTNEKITFIRPLVLTREEEIIKAHQSLEIPIIKSGCPADKHTQREAIKNDLKHLYETYKDSEKNIEHILTKSLGEQLWFDKFQMPLTSELYLEKASNAEQYFSFFTQYQKENKGPVIGDKEENHFLIKRQTEVVGVCILSSTNGVYEMVYISPTISELKEIILIKVSRLI